MPAPAPPDSVQDIVHGMLKYVASGDAKDLGKLGEYLGLVPETEPDLAAGSASAPEANKNSSPAASTNGNQVQKPKNPVFKLPISYIPKYDQHPVSAALSDDLELLVAKDPESTRPLYESLVIPDKAAATVYAKQYLYAWGETFTTNVLYLQNTQTFIARFCEDRKQVADLEKGAGTKPDDEFKDVDEFWTAMKTNRIGFKDKFGYFDVPPLPVIERIEELNQVPAALQILSVYNVSTPVISLLMPVLLLILPFFIIKSRGIDINVDKYVEVLKALASSHAVGKLFTEFSSVSVERKMYLIMSVVFYIMQIYQNTMSCYRFYKNIYTIHNHLILAREYLKRTVVKMERVLRCCCGGSLKYYTAFSGCLSAELNKVRAVCYDLECVQPFSLSFDAVSKIGYVMKHYYLFFKDTEVDAMMRYSFGFNAYYEHLCGIAHHVDAGVLHPCTFVEGETERASAATSMQDAYFLNTAGSAGSAVVKNDIALDKKLIITGPNAAGKTTIIKTALFNVLLSQQLGYGVYKTATIVPYHFLHCYLNIPDTSGRDSLFQAESRRCKEILDCVTEHASKRHFGIFDELYSGTNPYEAVASAYGYIDHISGMKNVDFMLTTHYIRLCELFHPSKKSKKSKKSAASECAALEPEPGNPNIRNLHMKTTVGESGTDHVYHYKVVHGISKVRGGIKVLVDLKYPDSIIQTTRRIINSKT